MKMKLYSTLWQDEKINQTESEVVVTDESAESRAVEMQVVNVYPQVTYQTIFGFGGAMTEAAGYALAQLSEEDLKAALKASFGEGGKLDPFLAAWMPNIVLTIWGMILYYKKVFTIE